MKKWLVVLVVLAGCGGSPEAAKKVTPTSSRPQGSAAFCSAYGNLGTVMGEDIRGVKPAKELADNLVPSIAAIDTEASRHKGITKQQLEALSSAASRYRVTLLEGGDKRTAGLQVARLGTNDLPECPS